MKTLNEQKAESMRALPARVRVIWLGISKQ